RPFDAESIFVCALDSVVNASRIVRRRLLQNDRQCGACVFHVCINLTCYHSFVTNQCAAEVEFAIDAKSCLALDLLREKLSENHLFGKVLGPNHNSVRTRTGGKSRGDAYQAKQAQQFRESFLNRAEAKIGNQRKCSGRNCARKNQTAIDHGQSPENEHAEATSSHCSCNRSNANRNHSGYTDSPEDPTTG